MTASPPTGGGMALLALCIDAAIAHVDDNEHAIAYVIQRFPLVDREAATTLLRSLRFLIMECKQ